MKAGRGRNEYRGKIGYVALPGSIDRGRQKSDWDVEREDAIGSAAVGNALLFQRLLIQASLQRCEGNVLGTGTWPNANLSSVDGREEAARNAEGGRKELIISGTTSETTPVGRVGAGDFVGWIDGEANRQDQGSTSRAVSDRGRPGLRGCLLLAVGRRYLRLNFACAFYTVSWTRCANCALLLLGSQDARWDGRRRSAGECHERQRAPKSACLAATHTALRRLPSLDGRTLPRRWRCNRERHTSTAAW